ncbi:MAG: elongation factor P maturation arginine rhamnosyltransferase EarP, partial [Succinivibrio sp.]
MIYILSMNTIDIFCDVIDNYGDAGVCLRLGRDLTKNNCQVRIFCNDLNVINTITGSDDQNNSKLKILSWPSSNIQYTPSEIVIQAFSVRLPDNILFHLKDKKSLVINLEYLTAEDFAEDCHTLPSYTDGMVSYFFFPGFTSKTGGVIIEDELLSKINSSNKNAQITLFSYENERVKEFLDKLDHDLQLKMNLLLFEGKPLINFNSLYKTNHKVKDIFKEGNYSVIVKQMTDQNEYDTCLTNSLINMVRGEDSIVRAMLTGNCFLWHIYPQDENAHISKINALFDCMNKYCTDKNAV